MLLMQTKEVTHLLLSSAVAERDWCSFIALDVTSASPLPHHISREDLAKMCLGKFSATELPT